MPVKILFSITYYLPYVSGLTLAASRWAEGLVRSGESVTALTMRHERGLREIWVIRGVRVERAKPIFRISKGFLSWDWVVKSWQQVQKHDVIVVNLPQFEGVIPALFGRVFGKRVIAIYHCEIKLPQGFVNSVIQSLIEVSHMITLLLADVVVTYTRDYAISSRLLRLLKLPRSLKMKYIVPPISKPRENIALTKQLQKKIGNADYIIGVAARLAREKGIEYLLEAMPLVKSQIPNPKSQTNPNSKIRNSKQDIKIVFAGSLEPVGEVAYKEEIMKLVKKHHDQIVFLGEIPPEYMGSFYKLIDVLVLPSVNSTESFGMVQVEAMRWGKPVVASDLPGVRVPVQETGMGVVVPPRNAIKLAEAIMTLLHYTKPQTKKRIFPEEQSVEALLTLIHQ